MKLPEHWIVLPDSHLAAERTADVTGIDASSEVALSGLKGCASVIGNIFADLTRNKSAPEERAIIGLEFLVEEIKGIIRMRFSEPGSTPGP